ncbi:hypothetical protein DMUE_4734 [Dictyocoela muelleri]|nr:hypothetical protein DMUE_4734 [Dictyocoela muelleri]
MLSPNSFRSSSFIKRPFKNTRCSSRHINMSQSNNHCCISIYCRKLTGCAGAFLGSVMNNYSIISSIKKYEVENKISYLSNLYNENLHNEEKKNFTQGLEKIKINYKISGTELEAQR